MGKAEARRTKEPSQNPILWNLARADGHRQRAVLRKEFEAKLAESWRQKLERGNGR